MSTAPCAAFRRLSLALALLATTWSLPGAAWGDAYPLQTVQQVADTLKPNVLIVLETAESLQDLPGENAARYNEVGADCEEGNRHCRLVGQDGRWNFSGMGKNGMYFGVAPTSCTSTETYTDVGTTNTTTSGTTSTTTNTTVTTTVSSSGTQTGTASSTATKQVTENGTTTVTGNATGSGTVIIPVTVTGTASANATGTAYPPGTGTAAGTSSAAVTATTTAQLTTTQTSTSGVTLTGVVTATVTATLTGTVTSTQTGTMTASATNQTAVATKTVTATVSATGSISGTGTVTASGTTTGSGTVTGTLVVSLLGGGTTVATGNGTGTGSFSGSNTSTSVVVGTAGATVVGTATLTQTITAPSVTVTITKTGTGTGTVTKTGTQTATASGLANGIAGGGTANNTARVYTTSTPGGTSTFSTTATYNSTSTAQFSWTYAGTSTHLAQNNNPETLSSFTYTNPMPVAGSIATGTGQRTATATITDSSARTMTNTITLTVTGTANVPNNVNNVTSTYQGVTYNNTRNVTGTGTFTYTNAVTFPAGTWTGTGTATGTYGSVTATTTNTNGTSTTQTMTLTSTHALSGTATGTVRGTAATVTVASATLTGSATVTASGVATGTGQWTGNGTVTATALLSMVGTGTQTASGSMLGTGTGTLTGTISAIGTGTQVTSTSTTTTTTISTSGTATATYSQTLTHTISTCGFSGSIDPNRCDAAPSTPTSAGYCNDSSGAICSSDGVCSTVKGDFCRFISATDGSGRAHSESCISSPGSQWGSCKHGVVTANTTCSNSTVCTLPGDFCAEGQPAKMCADSGIWCKDVSDCPGNALTDLCLPATSRMMTVKRALRRAITDHADKVNFGFMNSYQGKGVGTTNITTEIFPYVQLTSCPSSNNLTETKLLTRGELEKAGCFSLATGPTSPCTIDYGGNGAINGAASDNQIIYTKISANDSRWAIPRGDGSGRYGHADPTLVDTSWSGSVCGSSPILPACDFGSQGTGLYEGSYYSFSYKQGTPVASGSGSMAQPIYNTTYRGKFYSDGTFCYSAIDAERTDIVNDGIYGRPAYTLALPATSPYTVTGTGTATSSAIDTSKEVSVPVPWGGSTNAGACDGTTGAIWNSNVVPFLNSSATQTGTVTDTFTFNGHTITRAQKTMMTTARLEKASFGGVDATGRLAPIGCALGDAASYMTTVKSNDKAAANAGDAGGPIAPCWSNNIVLVVDGQSNGFGDTDATGTIDCASTACAYSAGNTDLAGCNCSAITRALSLAASGVQTHMVVNAPATWSTRYPYTYAFLWNVAVAGSLGLRTPSFGTTEDEVFKGIKDKIAEAAYHFPYTTTVPVAGATTQDPTSQILAPSNLLFDTSVSYPSWKGTVRAFDTTSGLLKWSAATVAPRLVPDPAHPEKEIEIAGHPTSWNARRILFSENNSANTLHQVTFSGSDAAATVDSTTGSLLHSAGLGADSAEAQRIMNWLLGKPGPGRPGLGNPAPLMGPVTSSVPIVVGQGASNGLNGSAAYSVATWNRPQLVYVGADDGMLHAFFGHVDSKTYNSVTYYGGEEAFAFIPSDMLPVITRLYAQGGQNLAVDKRQHIFGLAASPKVKDMCIGSGCETSTGSGWRSVLVMPEGPGGNKPFALDITNVISDSTGLHTDNLSLLWSAATSSSSTIWDRSLGETTSLPGFYFAGYVSGAADNRAIFASGYPTPASKATATSNMRTKSGYDKQGLIIVDADAASGTIKATQDVSTISVTSCAPRTRALMGDVALARDYTAAATSQNLMGAYVVDTWGNTFQYVPTAGMQLSKLYSLGSGQPLGPCGQPLYFSPTVVQLDRLTTADTSSKRYIYLAQVTNSNLDPATSPYSTSYPGSQLVVTKLNGNVIPPEIVTSYNTAYTSGQVVLSTDSSTPSNRICLQVTNSGTGLLDNFTDSSKKANQSCADAGGTPLPSTARPVATPTAVLRSDGLGFQVITSWHDPTAMTNDCSGGSQFNYGTSYVTVHEFGADGTWYQIAGVTLNNTVLTGVSFIGTGLFVDGINASSTPQSINLGESFSSMQQIFNNNAIDRYTRTTWTERVDP